jgi:hypothetical protein
LGESSPRSGARSARSARSGEEENLRFPTTLNRELSDQTGIYQYHQY